MKMHCLAILCLLSFVPPSALAQDDPPSLQGRAVTSHRYEITLSADEFFFLHGAAFAGVKKYGGDADFRVRINRVDNDAEWLVTVTNPRLMDVWSHWMAEKTADLVGMVDIDRLDDASRYAFRVVRSINAKLAQAKTNPIWDPITVVGRVTEKDGARYIEGKESKYELTGNKGQALAALGGQSVVVRGLNKTVGTLEVDGFALWPENTLEICAMSFCPFAQRAIQSVIHYLGRDASATSANNNRPVRLNVRYIFYRKLQDGKPVFSSMHGDREVNENLVEMTIRDMYGAQYQEYLLRRAEAGNDTDWKKLASECGLAALEIEQIETVITNTRDELIEREYGYVAGTLGILDTSPTFVWEGQPVPDLRKISQFAGLMYSSERCSGD